MGNHKSAQNTLLQASRSFAGRGSCWLIYTTALMVLLAGLWVAKEAGTGADLQMRRDLVRQVTDIAAAVNPASMRALSFTADDKARPEFQRLCAQMRAYAEATGLSSLYTMALRNGQVVFGPESLAEGHPYASPPGTVYQEPSQQDFELFQTGKPQIQGPFHDEYGTFVSALAPVFDPYTGEVLAAIGIDVEASAWRAAVRRAQWSPAGITMALLLVLLLNWLTLKHRHQRSAQRHGRRRHAETVLVAVFMSLLTLVLALKLHQAEREVRRNTFRQLAQIHAAACTKAFHDLYGQLDQLVSFFESSQEVTREEFRSYCKKMVQGGVLQGCGWLPVVPEADAAAFIQKVRDSGLPDFYIWQKNEKNKKEPVSSRPVYYPALYIVPLAGRETALGYDLNSEPLRSAAVQETLRTGLPTATDPVRFIVQTNPSPGLCIVQRVEAPVQKGLVAFSARLQDMLGGAQYRNRKNLGVDICLFHLQCGEKPLFLAGSSSQCGVSYLEDKGSGLTVTVPVFRFGKAYVLRLQPDSSWLAAHPLRQGRITGVFGMLITLLVSSVVALITNRRIHLEKLVEQRTSELQASESRYRLLAGNIQDVITVFSVEGKALYASPSMKTVLGYAPEEFSGTDMYALIHPEDRSGLEKAMGYLMKEGSVVHEARFRTRSGQYIWLATSAKLLPCGSGEPQELVCSSRDITGRKQAQERIHLLARHLETVREEERKRLSRELHDDIGQILTALKIDLLMVMDACTCPHGTKQKMADMQRLLSEGIQSVHSLCRRLRPGALDDLGLEEALSGLVDDWKRRNQMECTFCADMTDEALSDDVKTGVFRMVQEALTNVSRYARASRVEITLVSNENRLCVSIADNGCGMEAGAANKPTAFGLLGMHERIEALGGDLHIESVPDKGVRIEANIPL